MTPDISLKQKVVGAVVLGIAAVFFVGWRLRDWKTERKKNG